MRIGMFLLIFSFSLFTGQSLQGQCDSIIQQVDEFDSTLIVAHPWINVGYTVASNFQTLDGPKMIEEGKIMLSYASNDSTGSFFLRIHACCQLLDMN